MNLDELKTTDIWNLYEQGKRYLDMINVFSDTDKNYRMYNGDQWEGLKINGIEKIQLNFIKPIVKYKTGMILTNLYAINYSSENFENKEFRKNAEKICKLLNKKASRIWEHDYMDLKLRLIARDSAINDEGIMYIYYDEDKQTPINEVINKVDVFYGNENDPDMQLQPYILIKQRKPIIQIQEIARVNGVSEEEIRNIVGDTDNQEEAGDASKYEKDDMCTIVTKLYKEKGTVHFCKATKYLDIKKDTDTGLTYYPIAHMIWEDKKGSARGEGEVRELIPNQLETNKIAMRRAIAVKNTAYPQKVINSEKIVNPSSANEVGAVIKIKGGITVDDVNKVFANISPAQMSPDVEKLQNELISSTRELSGAGDIATGQVNPESASGRAILAVQQASNMPLTEHQSNLKGFVEDLARIWLDYIIIYSKDGVQLEDDTTNPQTGEEMTQLINIPQASLKELQATVKVDVTPKGAFDKYAQEMSMENLLKNGYFSTQRLPELKLYVKTLDDDSVMPKQKLLDMIEEQEAEQKKIAEMNAQAQLMQQKVNQYFMNDMASQPAIENTQQSSEQVPTL